jgi:hypothetical protein
MGVYNTRVMRVGDAECSLTLLIHISTEVFGADVTGCHPNFHLEVPEFETLNIKWLSVALVA